MDASEISYDATTGESGWSVYAEEALKFFGGRLAVNGGGRYISSSEDPQAVAHFIPNLGVVYRVIAPLSIYASLSESFTPETGKDIFGHDLQNIIGKSREGGVKFNALNGHLFGTLDYFDVVVDPVRRQFVPVLVVAQCGSGWVG